jgi:hypothetical protein
VCPCQMWADPERSLFMPRKGQTWLMPGTDCVLSNLPDTEHVMDRSHFECQPSSSPYGTPPPGHHLAHVAGVGCELPIVLPDLLTILLLLSRMRSDGCAHVDRAPILREA